MVGAEVTPRRYAAAGDDPPARRPAPSGAAGGQRLEHDVGVVAGGDLGTPLVDEQGQAGPVAALEDLDAALAREGGRAVGVGASGDLVVEAREADRRVELVGHAVLDDLELHRADGGQDRVLVPAHVGPQHLHHALLVELLDAAPELPVTKCSGAKLGTGGYSIGSPT